LEDAKGKKGKKKPKKGEEEIDEFAVDYKAIEEKYSEPVYEKMVKSLLVA